MQSTISQMYYGIDQFSYPWNADSWYKYGPAVPEYQLICRVGSTW